jgi:hypothetical protein
MDEGSRSNAQYRRAGGNPGPDAWGTEAQGTHDKKPQGSGKAMPGMTSAPRKGRRDFEPANCLNETGVDCTRVQAQGFAHGWAATVMSPCGVVNCKVLGSRGPLLTNRMTKLVTYGSVGGVGGNPGPYPAGNQPAPGMIVA